MMHGFFELDGYHICDDVESFRRGYCEDCAEVIDLEGLCVHGSYPDVCGACDDEAQELLRRLEVKA